MPRGETEIIQNSAGTALAYQRSEGKGPTVVWLGGFRSDLSGTKAERLHHWAEAENRAFLRFDYSGHGQSGGEFEDGDIGLWAADALYMIDARTTGPLVLVGSSMGGWIGLKAAVERADRVVGLMLIAPAPDFTERLMWAEYPESVRDVIMREGRRLQASEYGEPYPITRRLIEGSRAHLVLDRPIPFDGRVRILHGQADADVPWRLSLEIAERLTSSDVRISFVKSGDHRLSRPAELDLIVSMASQLCKDVENG